MCSDLCKREIVEAVLSEDTDVLAYGAPVFLSKINTYTGMVTRINYKKLLKKLNLTSNEFLDVCIMCGTDYNKNIFRVGPDKSYKYIQKYSSIEEIKNNTNLDISVLTYVRVRELFQNYEKKDIDKVYYCGRPDFLELDKFIKKYNIKCNLEFLKKSFTFSSSIIFK